MYILSTSWAVHLIICLLYDMYRAFYSPLPYIFLFLFASLPLNFPVSLCVVCFHIPEISLTKLDLWPQCCALFWEGNIIFVFGQYVSTIGFGAHQQHIDKSIKKVTYYSGEALFCAMSRQSLDYFPFNLGLNSSNSFRPILFNICNKRLSRRMALVSTCAKQSNTGGGGECPTIPSTKADFQLRPD